MEQQEPNKFLNSRAYRRAKKMAAGLIAVPEKLLALVTQVTDKSSRLASGRIVELLESLTAITRLIKAYAAGEYRDISLESVLLIIASLIYFVMPFDAIPDFLLNFGFIDDAALLAWTLRAVAEDLERFYQWETTKNERTDPEQKNLH